MNNPGRAAPKVLLLAGVIPVLAGVGWITQAHLSSPSPPVPTSQPAPQVNLPLNGIPYDADSTEPVGAIAARLAYEKERVQAQKLPDNTWSRLDAVETVLDQEKPAWQRAQGLLALHVQSTSDFVEAQGFGYSRMIPLAPHRAPLAVELEEAPPQAFTRYDATTLRSKDRPQNTGMSPRTQKLISLAGLHVEGMLGFFNSGGLGLVAPAARGDRVDDNARYRPHGFADEIELQRAESPLKNRWLVHRLELVSLLKQEQACVYASETLPRMQDRRRPKTRPLTAFESKALDALRQGDDLVSEATPDRIDVLGSLRAGWQCLDCHEVQRGALLGAFTYQLRRQR
jgi:hypothetical protein